MSLIVSVGGCLWKNPEREACGHSNGSRGARKGVSRCLAKFSIKRLVTQVLVFSVSPMLSYVRSSSQKFLALIVRMPRPTVEPSLRVSLM